MVRPPPLPSSSPLSASPPGSQLRDPIHTAHGGGPLRGRQEAWFQPHLPTRNGHAFGRRGMGVQGLLSHAEQVLHRAGEERAPPPRPRPSLVALTLHSWPLWLSRIWNRDGGGEGAESSTQSVPRAGGLSITSPGCLLEMGPGSQPPDPLGQNLHFHDLE